MPALLQDVAQQVQAQPDSGDGGSNAPAPDGLLSSSVPSNGVAPDYGMVSTQGMTNAGPQYSPPVITKALTGPNLALANIQTYVPGMGMIGPDLEGAVKGDILRREQGRADIKTSQDQDYLALASMDQQNKNDMTQMAADRLGIDLNEMQNKNTEFGWKTEDRNRQQMIIKGMAAAGQQGGYGAAINFLKTVDPKQALTMETSKLKLDSDIMKNKVMQAQVPNALNQAMFASYALLGKMDQGVMNAPPEQRDAVYQASLPLRLQVNPGASKTWDQTAQSNALLSTSQAMPENVLWNTAAQQALLKTDAGQNAVALGAALKSDPSGQGPLVQRLIAEGKSLDDKTLQNSLTNAKAQADVYKKQGDAGQAVVKGTEALNTSMENSNPGYKDFLTNYGMMKPNMDVIKANPNSPEAYVAGQGLVANYAKMLSGKRINPATMHQAFIDNHMQDLEKKVQSESSSSGKIPLSPTELTGLTQVLNSYADTEQTQQLKVESQHTQSAIEQNNQQAKAFPDNPLPAVNIKALRYPSQQFYSIQNANSGKATPQGNNLNLSGLPPDIQASVQGAIKRSGGNPEAMQQINQKLMQYRQQNQSTGNQ